MFNELIKHFLNPLQLQQRWPSSFNSEQSKEKVLYLEIDTGLLVKYAVVRRVSKEHTDHFSEKETTLNYIGITLLDPTSADILHSVFLYSSVLNSMWS